MFNYFTTDSIATPNQFYAIPKSLFTDKAFDALSTDSKVLYSVLRDRVSLSIKNKLADSLGRIYIIFKQADIESILKWGSQKVNKLFAELNAFGLIERKKQGKGLPDMIYVKNFCEQVVDNTTCSVDNSSDSLQTCENHNLRNVKIISPVTCENHNAKLTDNKLTNQNENNIINPSNEQQGLIDYSTAITSVKNQVEYDSLVDHYDREACDVLDNIVKYMAMVKSNNRGYANINGQLVMFSTIRHVFDTLDQFHIEYVIECVCGRDSSAPPIKNMKSYLITALYNAPDTIDEYYRQLVRHEPVYKMA